MRTKLRCCFDAHHGILRLDHFFLSENRKLPRPMLLQRREQRFRRVAFGNARNREVDAASTNVETRLDRATARCRIDDERHLS